VLRLIGLELRQHAPFTAFGAITGVVIMLALVLLNLPRSFSYGLFWTLHPLHVLLSAMATTSMYRLRGRRSLWATVFVGYVGSIGIATLSDSILPFVGEWSLQLPDREMHVGFIEKWWLVNPLAGIGIGIAFYRPQTALPHAGHVLLSTWASLFHLSLAIGNDLTLFRGTLVLLFLFLAVWIPCCTSDIVFPLLFARRRSAVALARVDF
jgi:hypothetical protein